MRNELRKNIKQNKKVKASPYLSSKRGGPPFDFYIFEYCFKRVVNRGLNTVGRVVESSRRERRASFHRRWNCSKLNVLNLYIQEVSAFRLKLTLQRRSRVRVKNSPPSRAMVPLSSKRGTSNISLFFYRLFSNPFNHYKPN